MRVLMLGQAGSGKTRWAVSQFIRINGESLLPRPVKFYSETGAINIKRIASEFGVDLEDVDIEEYRPTLSDFEFDMQKYKTIIVDHLLRIKDIRRLKIRDMFEEMIEKSNINWLILAHTLKGKAFEDLDVDSGKYTSGIAEVVDIVLGIGSNYERTLIKVLKDRQYDFEGRNLFRWDYQKPIVNWQLPNKR